VTVAAPLRSPASTTLASTSGENAMAAPRPAEEDPHGGNLRADRSMGVSGGWGQEESW
jgi:hypothetical protein